VGERVVKPPKFSRISPFRDPSGEVSRGQGGEQKKSWGEIGDSCDSSGNKGEILAGVLTGGGVATGEKLSTEPGRPNLFFQLTLKIRVPTVGTAGSPGSTRGYWVKGREKNRGKWGR